jgi:hypothetical protein
MTCTIIGLVVACSGVNAAASTPEQALAIWTQHDAQVVNSRTAEPPVQATRPNTAEESLALMKLHEKKIVLVPIPDWPAAAVRQDAPPQRPLKFGQSPWWLKELYDTWWYEPWVAKPWQLEPLPEPCCPR